ncbi:anaphase-promoting complex subunit 7 [Spatholobus suberectus]|nr:anaphase-promoting complex subunit 7 [Spatholobus suberectus]
MEQDEKQAMIRDIALQVVLILLAILAFLATHGVPQRLFAKLLHRPPNPRAVQAKRHFVTGAQLLAEARRSPSNSASLAKQALAEAESAIALDPKDAASHLLKSMALDLQGFRGNALEALDAALSPLAAGSLADDERGDALLKRAELKIKTSERRRVDSVLADLTESVKLSPRNAKAWRMLGECYEGNKMGEEAKKAYKEALELEPQLNVAQEALNRLGSS